MRDHLAPKEFFMRPLYTLLCLLCMIVPAFAAPATVKPVEISGTVMVAETNKPISGATVSCFAGAQKGASPAAVRKAVSDKDGAFTLRLPPGNYSFSTRADGFAVMETRSTVYPDQDGQKLSFYLFQPIEISGRLVTEDGKPITSGIIVANGKYQARPDANGRFSLRGLNPGSYTLTMVKAGWALSQTYYSPYFSQAANDIGDLTAQKTSDLRLLVTTMEGEKTRHLNKIRVIIDGPNIYRYASIDSGKETVLSKLVPGKYSVMIEDERLERGYRAVDVTEGQPARISMTTKFEPPFLSINHYQNVVLPDKPMKIRGEGLWMEKAEAIIAGINNDDALTAMATGEDLLEKGIPLSRMHIVKTIPVLLKNVPKRHYRPFTVTIPGLSPGLYQLILQGKGAETRYTFLVTELGVVAKTSPEGTLLYAANLVTGASVPDVTIKALPSETILKTNADGLATMKPFGSYQKLIASAGNSLAFLNLGTKRGGTTEETKGYLYTDRPVYRPGQTVYFKGVLRQKTGEAYSLPNIKTVTIAVKNSDDEAVCEMETDVTKTGSFQGSCDLPPAPPLGRYTINAEGGGQSWTGYFRIMEYRKPEFEVKLVPQDRFILGGDATQVKATARYYFGAPVANATLAWRVYAQPAWHLASSDAYFNDDEDDYYGGGYSDFVGEGEITLDENGDGLFSITAQNHDMPYTYTIEADVTDLSSRRVSSSGSLNVVPSLVSMQVKAETYLSRPGNNVDLTVRSANWEGKPCSLPVKLYFERQKYDKQHGYSWETAHGADIQTDKGGVATSRYNFPQPGYWKIRAEATDQRGRKAEGTTFLWVWENGYAWRGSYRSLEAEFDRKSYKPGETARLIVRSPQEGGSLLLSMEGRDILNYRTIPMSGSVQVIEVPVTETYAPYVHVSTVLVGEGRFFTRTLPLRVDYQPSKLDIAIKTDKPLYAPGDTVRMTFSTKTAQKTVPADLSLAVVDEAIFAIAPERRDDIYTFFRGSRDHLVNTVHSFTRVYLGGASKTANAPLSAEADDEMKNIRVRKSFKDTAFWMPMVTTHADGTARAEFTLPDNLTTWRVTAIGNTMDSDFGTSREKFISRLDFMARLSPPRFLVAGDEVYIPGVLTSMVETEQKVKGRFEAQGLSMLVSPSFEGNVAPNGTLRQDMLFRANTPSEAVIRLLALGNDNTNKRGDALELSLPVLTRGVKRLDDGGLSLRDSEGTTTAVIPDTALDGSARLQVIFEPTIVSGLNSAVTRLVEFPYGCVEQTLSRFIPAVYAEALLRKEAWSPDEATRQKLPLAINEGLKRLADMQHGDGGWGWWANDHTSLTMTAHALYGLGLAKKAGLAVSESMMASGVASLREQIKTAHISDTPRAYRALTLHEAYDEELEKKISASWDKLPLAEQLAFTEALAFAGKNEAATALLNDIKKHVQTEGTAAYIRDEAADSWWYGWRWGSSAVETTSSLLSQLIRTNPGDPLAERLAQFLTRHKTGGWWRTTASSAAAVTALADYVSASGEAKGKYTATLYVNGKKAGAYRVEDGALVSGSRQLYLPASALTKGANTVKLTKEGTGVAYLSTSLTYAVSPDAAQSSAGMRIAREMYRIASIRGKDGAPRLEYTRLKPGESVAVGEDIEVRLLVNNEKALEYVVIEDPLPAGFESRETAYDARFRDTDFYTDWYAQKERRDERMAFFMTELTPGNHEFRYIIYPELAGKVIALPASFWPMYQPELRGESAAWEVTVRP